MQSDATTVEGYLASLPEERRGAIETVRDTRGSGPSARRTEPRG